MGTASREPPSWVWALGDAQGAGEGRGLAAYLWSRSKSLGELAQDHELLPSLQADSSPQLGLTWGTKASMEHRTPVCPRAVRSRAKKRTTLPRTFLGLTHMGGSSTSAKPCTALGSWRSSQPASPSFSPQLEPRPQGGHGTPSQAERFGKAGGRKHTEHSPRSPRNLRDFKAKPGAGCWHCHHFQREGKLIG